MKQFYDVHVKILIKEEWINNLMIKNISYGLENNYDGWIFGNLLNNEKIDIIFLHRRPWKLLIYSLNNENLDNKLKFLSEEIYKVDNDLNGVNAETEISQKFSKFYCQLSNKKFEEKMKLRILVLTKINPGELNNNLNFRKAELKDKIVLKKYIYDMIYEVFGKKKEHEEIESSFQKVMKSGFYIIENIGNIVSQAAVNANLINGKSLGCVYTPREERNKGYCYNLIYRLCEDLLKKGENKFICLYTDDTNPISNHIYEKVGFERKMDCIEMDFLN